MKSDLDFPKNVCKFNAQFYSFNFLLICYVISLYVLHKQEKLTQIFYQIFLIFCNKINKAMQRIRSEKHEVTSYIKEQECLEI